MALPDFLKFVFGLRLDSALVKVIVDCNLLDQIFIHCFRLFFIVYRKCFDLALKLFSLDFPFLLQSLIKLEPDRMFLLLNL
jgi:hypothetical protein